MTMRCLMFAAAVGAASSVDAADWPQWRGPDRDGISKETGLLKTWPEGGPKLVWQSKEVGGGYSTPSVVGDRIYLIGDDGESESVLALNVRDGKAAWSVPLGKVGPNTGPQYPGSRSTPTVDGSLLYALGSDGDLACLDAKTGKVRWTKSLRDDFAGQPGKWAYAESPLVDGDKLIVTPGGSEATIVALDKTTGEPVWKSSLPALGQAAYASAVAAEIGGKPQYVQFFEKGVAGVDAESGKLLWSYDKTAQGSPANIPTPVVRDDYVYTATGRAGGGLVKIETSGGTASAEEVYFAKKLPSAIGGSVVTGGHLYGTGGEAMLCVDFATGDVKWEERGIGAGAVLLAEGRLYVRGENGAVALVEATPEAYRELGRFTPAGAEERTGRQKAWAYPVVASGRLYVRDQNSLWSYDVKAK
jgi:outer membrane protein assembly factor BamB